MARWTAQGLAIGCVSINAAPAEFLRDDYAEHLLSAISRFGIDPRTVEVEVTEQVFAERGGDYVRRALHRLHGEGVRISLDDFGTGYSSLSHLRDFPVDVVKVDRSFVQQVIDKSEIAAIAKAVSHLCTSLGIEVVAEGVETEAQATWLMKHGFTSAQGFLYSRPAPAKELPAFLMKHVPRLLAGLQHA